MFGIGLPELIVILAVALIVVGPDKLPDLAKTLAKQVLELKKAASSLKDSLQEEASEGDRKPFQTVDTDQYLPEKMAERARQIAQGEEPVSGGSDDEPGPEKPAPQQGVDQTNESA